MGLLNTLFGSTSTSDELGKFVSGIGEDILKAHGDRINNEGILWIQSKRNEHSGGEYVRQLEVNSIYAVESLLMALSALTTFIITEVELSEDFVVQHIQNGQGLARDKVQFHLAFLHAGCNGCIVHDDHNRYKGLKDIKDAGSTSTYIEELEFWCRYYRAMQSFSMAYLDAFIQNIALFQKYGSLSESLISGELEKYIKLYSNICIGNVNPS